MRQERHSHQAAVALLVHGLAYASGVWLLGFATHSAQDWVLWYALGALALVLALPIGKLHIEPARALQILFFAALIALWFWGANFALDALGNSVQARRTPSHLQDGLPLHFILVPGVASVALALYASTFVRRQG
jgi:hypothetical protein